MDQATGTGRPPAAPERSAGDLIKLMSEQVSALVRDELKLAQLEMTRKGKQAGMGAGSLAAAARSPCTAPAAWSHAWSPAAWSHAWSLPSAG